MKFSIILVLSLILSGCASNVDTIGGRLLSPEAQGQRWSSTLSAGAHSTSEYKVSFEDNKTTSPLIHKGRSGGNVSVGSEVGIWKPVDLLLSVGGSDSYAGIKYQFLGTKRVEAKKGTYSASIVGLYSAFSENIKDDDNFASDNITKVDFNKRGTSYGLMLGYRLLDQLIFHIGTHKTFQSIHGNVTTTGNVLNDASWGYGNTALAQTLGLIYHGNPNRYLIKIEFSNLTTDWTRTGKRTNNGLNLALGRYW